MGLIQKTNPTGVDEQIQRLQSYLYHELTAHEGWTNYDCHERAYKTKKDDKIIPEICINNNYYEMLLDDAGNVKSFFLVDDSETINENLCTIGVSLIVEANIANLYPTVTHRADEELRSTIKRLLKLNPYSFKLTRITTGVENVYSDLDIEPKWTDDMNQYHVCRFDMDLYYNIDNC